MALKAMEYGKNVLVEKPMAISVMEADHMRDTEFAWRPAHSEPRDTTIVICGGVNGLLREEEL